MRPFNIGERVIHTLTNGRIRGVVKAIHITQEGTRVVVLVDRLHGRTMDYDARNLTLETDP